MNEELFGELHEQEEYGLFGKEHQRQQCFLYSVSDRTSSNNRLKIEPVYDGISTAGSLLSDEEIREAADEWVFDKNGMKWSNNDNTAGDNYGSFIAGVKWALSRLCNDR